MSPLHVSLTLELQVCACLRVVLSLFRQAHRWNSRRGNCDSSEPGGARQAQAYTCNGPARYQQCHFRRRADNSEHRRSENGPEWKHLRYRIRCDRHCCGPCRKATRLFIRSTVGHLTRALPGCASGWCFHVENRKPVLCFFPISLWLVRPHPDGLQIPVRFRAWFIPAP